MIVVDIDNDYKNETIADDRRGAAYDVATTARMLCNTIEAGCHEGREKEIALANLQTCVYWANKALSDARKTI